jgi:hypothetical protein
MKAWVHYNDSITGTRLLLDSQIDKGKFGTPGSQGNTADDCSFHPRASKRHVAVALRSNAPDKPLEITRSDFDQ